VNIVGDRLARPYLDPRTVERIAALVPPEVESVTVLARTGVGDWSVRLYIGEELVAASHFSREVIAGVEKAVHAYQKAHAAERIATLVDVEEDEWTDREGQPEFNGSFR